MSEPHPIVKLLEQITRQPRELVLKILGFIPVRRQLHIINRRIRREGNLYLGSSSPYQIETIFDRMALNNSMDRGRFRPRLTI